MIHFRTLTRAATASALLALTAYAGPAMAGKNDRAQQAIAEAKGKLAAGDKAGASTDAMGLTARARTSVANAENLLSHGKKDAAIVEAQRAGELADQAIAMSAGTKNAEIANAKADATATAVAARESAASADARAANAEQAASAAAADAAAARAAPPVVVAEAAPAPMTVTTTQKEVVRGAPTHHKVTKTVTKPGPKLAEKTTTTTVTAQPQ